MNPEKRKRFFWRTISSTGFGSGLKKYSRPTLKTIAIRNKVGSVGCITSRSSFESSAVESPVCLLNLHQPHALAQPEPPHYAANRVFIEACCNCGRGHKIEIVFPQAVAVSGVIFPLKKDSSPLFFTVKHTFFRIKTDRMNPADRNAKGKSQMKQLDVAAAALVIIGALNLGAGRSVPSGLGGGRVCQYLF